LSENRNYDDSHYWLAAGKLTGELAQHKVEGKCSRDITRCMRRSTWDLWTNFIPQERKQNESTQASNSLL